MYTKSFYLCHQKVIYLKIIWFYLVRAEVVLWWHCLIFFVRAKSRQKNRYMVGKWLGVGYFCRSFTQTCVIPCFFGEKIGII